MYSIKTLINQTFISYFFIFYLLSDTLLRWITTQDNHLNTNICFTNGNSNMGRALTNEVTSFPVFTWWIQSSPFRNLLDFDRNLVNRLSEAFQIEKWDRVQSFATFQYGKFPLASRSKSKYQACLLLLWIIYGSMILLSVCDLSCLLKNYYIIICRLHHMFVGMERVELRFASDLFKLPSLHWVTHES